MCVVTNVKICISVIINVNRTANNVKSFVNPYQIYNSNTEIRFLKESTYPTTLTVNENSAVASQHYH